MPLAPKPEEKRMSDMPSRRKKPPIIRQWYLTWYLRNYRLWRVLLAVVAASVSIGLVSADLFDLGRLLDDLTWPLVIFTLITLVWSTWPIVSDVIKTKKELAGASNSVHPHNSDAFEDFLNRVALPKELKDSGYKIVRGGFGKGIIDGHLFQGASVTSKDINRVLWDRSTNLSLPLQVSVPPARRSRIFGYPKLWEKPQITQQILYAILKALPALSAGKLANESKIRLSEDLLLPSEERELLIERTDYLSDLVTGQVTGVIVRDSGGHEIYNGYNLAYEWDDGKWKLKLCSKSGCSNQVGASSLALGVSRRKEAGSDALQGHIFIVEQAAGNIQSAGLLAPSGSGSLDWSDYTDFGDRLIVGGMREMLEETTDDEIWKELIARGQIQTVVTGFGRMLHRGGKPEFYGFVVMPRGEHEIGIDETERAYVKKIIPIEVFPLSANTLRAKLKAFARENQARLSHPLYLCINLLLAYLAEHPDRFEDIVRDVGKNAR